MSWLKAKYRFSRRIRRFFIDREEVLFLESILPNDDAETTHTAIRDWLCERCPSLAEASIEYFGFNVVQNGWDIYLSHPLFPMHEPYSCIVSETLPEK